MEQKEMRKLLKTVFRENDCFTSKNVRILTSLGFSVRYGKRSPHIKLLYSTGDRIYTFVVSKTPSDKRSGLNLVSNIMTELYRTGDGQ